MIRVITVMIIVMVAIIVIIVMIVIIVIIVTIVAIVMIVLVVIIVVIDPAGTRLRRIRFDSRARGSHPAPHLVRTAKQQDGRGLQQDAAGSKATRQGIKESGMFGRLAWHRRTRSCRELWSL